MYIFHFTGVFFLFSGVIKNDRRHYTKANAVGTNKSTEIQVSKL